MKKFLIALNIVIWGIVGYQASAYAVETKKVCIDQKDAKTGKTKQVCKNVKVHQKHEGTAIPTKPAPKKK